MWNLGYSEILVKTSEFFLYLCNLHPPTPLFLLVGMNMGNWYRYMAWSQPVDMNAVSQSLEYRKSKKSLVNIKSVYSWREGILQ